MIRIASLALAGSLSIGLVIGVAGFLGRFIPVAIPPTTAGPEAVLDAYLRTLLAGDCSTGRRLWVPVAHQTGDGDLCGDAWVWSYRIDGPPATLSASEADYAVTLTTTGSGDGSISAGQITWFYGLIQQPDGSWRIAGGGSGP